MYSNILQILLLLLVVGICLHGKCISAMSGKPQEIPESNYSLDSAPISKMTLKELAHIYWPNTNITTAQQEATLKNLLGKSVTWEIRVAQVQRDGSCYLVQGQSDENMIGTFSYVTIRNKHEENRILQAEKGSKLIITGIIFDMRLRHIVLQPATLSSTE